MAKVFKHVPLKGLRTFDDFPISLGLTYWAMAIGEEPSQRVVVAPFALVPEDGSLAPQVLMWNGGLQKIVLFYPSNLAETHEGHLKWIANSRGGGLV